MTMPVWPFPLVRPAGYTNGDTPTGPEIEQLQEQVAAAADGRIWTDLGVLKKWTWQQLSPVTISPRSLLRDPVSRRWMVFEGNTASTEFSIDGSRWFGSGTTNFGDPSPTMNAAIAAAASSGGVLLAGGQLVGSSAAKLRESTDGGNTWLTQRSVGAADTHPVNALTYSESLALWLCVLGTSDGIYSSSDRITWTKRSTLMPTYWAKADLPTTIIIANTLVGGSATNYGRTTDGITWTTETFPENVSSQQGCWSDAFGKFFLSGATGIWSSSTGLTGSWTKIWAGTIQASLGAFRRCLMRGDGQASIDGGVTWVPVLDLGGQTDLHVTATPFGVALARGASKDIYISQQVGL
jgi:hypothetical protein